MIDLAGTDMARLRHVEERFSELARARGFEEVRTPLIEFLHLYTRSGTLSPQLLGRVYSFLDWDGWSGERVVLRPDSTVAVARLYGERYPGQTRRLFYAQPVLRFAGADERRETWQCGAEVIGEAAGVSDIELILLAEGILHALGLADRELHLSHSGILKTLLARTGWEAAAQSAVYDRILDGDRSAVGETGAALSGLELGMKLLLESQGHGPEYVVNLKAAFSEVPELAGPLGELEEASTLLLAADVNHAIVTPLARDFEYYTGLVFHLQRQGEVLASGGRYDHLVQLVTGQAAPACGFALDSERVAAAIELAADSVPSIALIADETAAGPALRLLKALSNEGLAATLNPASHNGLVVEVSAQAYRRGEKVTPANDEGVASIVEQLSRETLARS
ncbi:MAG TPA: ATP phosphoribosyltransferase regulatory subunit [Rubrobacter sp.]|nr:ATP phosphoribosyltransferase regulatory subunit [Rubrobacter sp.]